MLNKKELETLLQLGLETGADFSEIFLEDTKSGRISVNNGEVISVTTGDVHGVGVRLLQGIDEVYGYSNDDSYASIEKLMLTLRGSFKGSKQTAKPLGEKLPYVNDIKKPHNSLTPQEKSKTLIELSNIIKNHDEKIIQAGATLIEWEQKVLIANSRGLLQDDVRTYTRCALTATAQDNALIQDAYEAPGRNMGFEIFDEIDFKALAKEVAESAMTYLYADNMEPQEMPVVIHNGFGGVIFHEAVGHPLETSAVSKGLSPFAGKLGQKVASEVVTAYDNGDDPKQWGRTTFDDEGHKTQKNLLIEKGILKGYLSDYKSGKRMNYESTGSGRRQSYKYAPTARMNTTYIENGTENYEDIIKDTPYGLFAKKLGGGTVNPATGEYNFAVMEGYMIENGKLTKPVRGAMLIGHGAETILNIDRVANNRTFGQGMCGAGSGSIPTDVGQPTIRVSKMLVGGQGGKK
ncbi:protease TldD [Acholeplasma oculi]|uniref:Zn-dependent protease TldD n=1 Tax=Acholeplasma oculi TaxID=35623 RepID=A0A061A9M5_9MOLU|nr:TldD/PmbA family protein [Acholeplasma oculi]CDR30568.1 Zn-dependent protease TldD [Acholeplasma oculi]SKC46974.1 TldD protein [Acholeplasma oculi]SUT89254.1 protease TldD [Acholeplasma oculi]